MPATHFLHVKNKYANLGKLDRNENIVRKTDESQDIDMRDF